MIDYLTLLDYIEIDERKLSALRWTKIINEYGEYYVHRKNTIEIKYYPSTTKIKIEGKISNLFSDSQVQNVDDLFGADTERFIEAVNDKL